MKKLIVIFLTKKSENFRKPVQDLKVRYGTINYDKGGYTRDVIRRIEHPQHTIKSMEYDISLLRLKTDITEFGTSVTRIILPSNRAKLPKPGQFLAISGWGRLSYDDANYSPTLRFVDIELISQQLCQAIYYNDNINDNVFCAGDPKGGKDACIGDSGGALVDHGVQYGIASWGHKCAEPNYPGVYTSVIAFRDFIEKETGI